MFKNSEEITLDSQRIPDHIAIIMDGNGRWAQKRHLPRIVGHKNGMNTVKTVTKAASDLGVKVLSLYAFSTENWKRPDKEVKYLMGLPAKFFGTFVPELIENNVRVNVMGYLDQLPLSTQETIQKAIDDTSHCNGMILNFALNYGGRDEIVTAAQKVAQAVKNGQINPEQVDQKYLADQLMTASLGQYADPDLLIRTSGEERISNFMLWQIAYSEFVFSDQYWPDFNAETLKQAIKEFQNRHRRFGGLNQK